MNHAEEQARAQYESLCAMLAAVDVDYDRLEELRDLEQGKHLDRGELEELAELEAAAGDCGSEETARQRISEDPLSVEVRSDWTAPGESMDPAEFRILLCTGGPAVQIRGELDRGEPARAWLEYQDWGTPWTQYFGPDFGPDSDTLCRYASFFFFGE